MKRGKCTVERRIVYTLEIHDIDPEMACDNEDGSYAYSEFAARKTLMGNQLFQWDCAAFGFPTELNVLESDNPDMFDVEIFWRA